MGERPEPKTRGGGDPEYSAGGTPAGPVTSDAATSAQASNDAAAESPLDRDGGDEQIDESGQFDEGGQDDGEQDDGAGSPGPATLEDGRGRIATWVREHAMLAIVAPTIAGFALAASLGGYSWSRDFIQERFGDPLSAEATVDQDQVKPNGFPVHGQYVIPELPADLKEPPPSLRSNCVVSYDWATGQGGVVTEAMTLDVVLQAKKKGTTVLRDVEVLQAVEEQAEPLSGSLPRCGSGAGGLSVLEVELFRNPEATTSEFVDKDGNPIPFDFDLNQGESVRFLVRVTVNDCLCRWSLSVDGSRQGRGFEFTVDDDGEPFEITSSENATEVYAIDGKWSTSSAPVALAAPPAGLELPEFTACNLITPGEWSEIVGRTVQPTIAQSNGVWTSAAKVPGLAPQATNGCYFEIGPARREDGDSLVIGVTRARTPEDAMAIAADTRERNGRSRWRTPLTGVFINETGSILLVKGQDVVSLDFITSTLNEERLAQLALPRARAALAAGP